MTQIERFWETIQTEKYKPIPTGLKPIDRAIGGGFIRQQLITLAAAPGVGKTALAQSIFETMAKAGHNVLFFNLEMSEEQLLARSLSRIAYTQGHSLNANQILQGYAWDEEQRKQAEQAKEEYERTISDHLVYNRKLDNTELLTILQTMIDSAETAKRNGSETPIIVLDYLQKIAVPGKDAGQAVKEIVTSLKNFARDYNTIVFGISANNRQSNITGITTMESGRDSSELEYSADLMLGLSYTALRFNEIPKPKGRTANKSDLDEIDIKRVTLEVLKSRFGGVMNYVKLHFDGATMTFIEDEIGQRVPNPPKETFPPRPGEVEEPEVVSDGYGKKKSRKK